jgi:hypothetical protein
MPNTYYEGQFAQKRRDPWRWPRLAGLQWNLETQGKFERCFRELSSILAALLDGTDQFGDSYIISQSSAAVLAGHLIHRTVNGIAYLATATDKTRYATDVVIKVDGNTIYSLPMGGYIPVFITNSTTGTAPPMLFLSTSPGLATFNEAESGAKLRQQIGFAKSTRGADGRCQAHVQVGHIYLLSD